MEFKVGDIVKKSRHYSKDCEVLVCNNCPFKEDNVTIKRIIGDTYTVESKYGDCDGIEEKEIELVLRKGKYNIGDTVIIKNISGYPAMYENLFKPYLNTKAKILRYSKQDEEILKGYEDYIYVLDIKHPAKDKNIYVKEDEIELYIKPKIEQKHYNIENLHIIVNHRAVIVIDTNTKKKGVAKCHPDDEFDFKVGLALAMERLNKQEEYQLIQIPLQGFGGTLYYYDKR